jgi:glycosyltransferase involved in cell wall biosynthesis
MDVKKVSIVIPTLNEEKNLEILLKEIKDFFKKEKNFLMKLLLSINILKTIQ